MADPWTHHTKTVNGFRMHYVSAGSGYPLVFLHGWPQSWYEWRKIIAPLAARFTVLAPDRRGLGDSERPLTGYDKRTLASDVYALVQALGFAKIGLTGHDWGGRSPITWPTTTRRWSNGSWRSIRCRAWAAAARRLICKPPRACGMSFFMPACPTLPNS